MLSKIKSFATVISIILYYSNLYVKKAIRLLVDKLKVCLKDEIKYFKLYNTALENL